MKKSILILLVILSFSRFVAAQTLQDEITMVQTMWGSEKREVIKEYMDLSESEAAGFWKIYDQYEEARKKLGQDRILLINDYVNNLSSITEEKANELATKMLNNSLSYEKLYKQYYPKFKKATSAIDAAKFLQLEIYITNSIRLAMQDELPFIGELERKKK